MEETDTDGVPLREQLEDLLRESQDLIGLAGVDGYLKWLNPAWSRVLGWTTEELCARPYLDFVHPDDAGRTADEAASIADGLPCIQFENRYRCKDGSWVWLSWNATPRDDGTLLCVCRDVTQVREQRRDQQERIRQLELAESLLEVGNWRVDLLEDTVYWSPVVFKIHGRDPAVFQPSLDTGIESYHPDDREEVQLCLERAITDRGAFAFTLRLIRADTGETRLVRSSGTVQCGEDGTPYAIVGVFQDITELTDNERRLSEANRSLHARMSELEERSEALQTMSTLGDMLQSALDVAESQEVLRALLPEIFRGLPGLVYLTDSESEGHHPVASWGDLAGAWRRADPASCWAVRRGMSHAVPECGSLRCRHLEGVTYGSRCVPMLAHGKLVGLLVLAAGTPEQQHRLEALENFPSTVANQIALAVSNLRLRDRLRQESLRDQLTGLYNRRFLDDWLNKQLSHSERTNAPISVAMLDLDHFKRFNDAHGHLVADELLVRFGEILSANVRSGDVACRWGGEEFVVAMPDCAPEQLEGVLRRIQADLALIHIEDEAGLPVQPPTLSAGIASFPADAARAGQLLQCADQALFTAKSEGRNRFIRHRRPSSLAA